MSNPRLTETSYIVLGLLEQAEPATPYDLKRIAQVSIVNFWSIPHTQLYAECQRLAEEGLLDERREEEGRRRRLYRLTAAGRKALDAWRREPTGQIYEVRDPGTLKLSLGAEPEALAAAQLAAHESKLEEFEQIAEEAEGGGEVPRGLRLTLDLGIATERTMVEFWSRLVP
jgi:DNA-binding PadR family transcriptional regulator